MMLFVMMYRVVLTFESVDKFLKCDHSNMEASLVVYLQVTWRWQIVLLYS